MIIFWLLLADLLVEFIFWDLCLISFSLDYVLSSLFFFFLFLLSFIPPVSSSVFCFHHQQCSFLPLKLFLLTARFKLREQQRSQCLLSNIFTVNQLLSKSWCSTSNTTSLFILFYFIFVRINMHRMSRPTSFQTCDSTTADSAAFSKLLVDS